MNPDTPLTPTTDDEHPAHPHATRPIPMTTENKTEATNTPTDVDPDPEHHPTDNTHTMDHQHDTL